LRGTDVERCEGRWGGRGRERENERERHEWRESERERARDIERDVQRRGAQLPRRQIPIRFRSKREELKIFRRLLPGMPRR